MSRAACGDIVSHPPRKSCAFCWKEKDVFRSRCQMGFISTENKKETIGKGKGENWQISLTTD
jgi:hypothetical protein